MPRVYWYRPDAESSRVARISCAVTNKPTRIVELMTSPIHKQSINPDLYYPVKLMYGNNCMAIKEIQGKYLLDKSNPQAWRYLQSKDKYPHVH